MALECERFVQEFDDKGEEAVLESVVGAFKLLYCLSNGRGEKRKWPECEWSSIMLAASQGNLKYRWSQRGI